MASKEGNDIERDDFKRLRSSDPGEWCEYVDDSINDILPTQMHYFSCSCSTCTSNLTFCSSAFFNYFRFEGGARHRRG